MNGHYIDPEDRAANSEVSISDTNDQVLVANDVFQSLHEHLEVLVIIRGAPLRDRAQALKRLLPV